VISTPCVPWCGQDRLDLLLTLKEGVQHRRRKLTELHRAQCNERIRWFHEHRRQRLDTPKSKEIKKLLQPVILNSSHATLRASKLLSKRHPVPDENHEMVPTILASPKVTVEFTRQSQTEWRLRISPVSELNEETFFATNAMNHRSTCPRFPTCSGSLNDITPMSKVRDKTRTIKFFCHKCTELYESVSEQGLQPCPIPDTILTANGFDSSTPILTAPLTSADFETYRRQRPTGRAAGEEIDGIGGVPYDRWNDGPPEMQSALYHAVSEIVTGRRAPPEWEGAVVKLLPKRPGEEHILESNRPICLMATTMKLVTGIWAHRLSKTAESLRTFRIRTGRESAGAVHQTANRPTTAEFGSSESPTELSLCCLFRHGKLLQCPQSAGFVLSIMEKRFA
jgi:hypothetical protein